MMWSLKQTKFFIDLILNVNEEIVNDETYQNFSVTSNICEPFTNYNAYNSAKTLKCIFVPIFT
ncbi:hypothetical protein A3Q56_07507 [Intoshia linei]|uniref:Uncharacterized protein n=1 Tax=Intoshia linei TaxID=1819745 RepID=A0A177AS02_9BILA|nr:hypothetical protein A3Q56_07507 [Intoshia linei]